MVLPLYEYFFYLVVFLLYVLYCCLGSTTPIERAKIKQFSDTVHNFFVLLVAQHQFGHVFDVLGVGEHVYGL